MLLSVFLIWKSYLSYLYYKEIRPLAEQGVVIWSSGLTRAQSNDIEKIQKIAFKIILEDNYISYDVACTILNTSPLSYRRTDQLRSAQTPEVS